MHPCSFPAASARRLPSVRDHGDLGRDARPARPAARLSPRRGFDRPRPPPAAAGDRWRHRRRCCSASMRPLQPSAAIRSARASCPALLPPGIYRFANAPHDPRLAALAFALGSYRFTRYRKSEDRQRPPGAARWRRRRRSHAHRRRRRRWRAISSTRRPTTWGRRSSTQAARALAAAPRRRRSAAIVGDDLLTREFPADPRGRPRRRARAPRLIDLHWGDPSHPKVTLVGKGVCFDTGGLDLKPSSGMLLMKKDMGGAANVLALAHMIMDRKLKVRLRVLIPAVENAIAGDAFRPLDVYPVAQGPHRRDRQHRRRRPAGPGRRAGARRRGDAGPADRHGHADRRRARRARPRSAAVLHR